MTNSYTAPITLGFTPANGDLIGGTVNGVEVNGEWKSGDFVALYEGALDVSTYRDVGGQHICRIGIADGQAQIVVQSKSTPPTDYELHLYRYTPADIVQIPQEYVEGLEDVAADATAAKTAAETAQTTANAAKTAAETAQTTANAAAPKNSPVFTGTFSQNRNSYSPIGEYSHAECLNTVASGKYSHAEGHSSYAISDASHAEGTGTNARGNYSHAEGCETNADGDSSHAEGSNTNASGDYSHAEGFRTIAKAQFQHVHGKFNIEDTANKYAHIVGNGNGDDNRSNAHTLTWSGVPWYQGRPQFGGSAMDDGAQTVMGNGDKDISLASSTTDSTKQIKLTVSDDARPTFTDTSDPNNTWTPGENLPTVTASDRGKFLRVSESGAWEAEETAIPTQVQSDWDQNDSTASDYVKNRPCYKIEELTWGEEQSVTVTNELSLTGDEFNMPAKIKGTCDGTSFEFKKVMNTALGVAFWGFKEYNAGTSDIYFSQTATRDSTSITVRNDGASHAVTYQVATASVTYKQIDEKYIPNPLPTVYAFNAGSFLRVNEAGKWAIEESLILNSSTPDSTKKFKITVNDAGAISATEVTT